MGYKKISFTTSIIVRASVNVLMKSAFYRLPMANTSYRRASDFFKLLAHVDQLHFSGKAKQKKSFPCFKKKLFPEAYLPSDTYTPPRRDLLRAPGTKDTYQPLPLLGTDRQTPVKTLPTHNYCCRWQ